MPTQARGIAVSLPGTTAPSEKVQKEKGRKEKIKFGDSEVFVSISISANHGKFLTTILKFYGTGKI
jgi:hypothetical protein